MNGWPSQHMARLLQEALREPAFAAQWKSDNDPSFTPYAVAALELRSATRLPMAERAALYQDLCLRKRVLVLAEAVGRPVTAQMLKVLGKTAWRQFTRRDWQDLFAITSGDDLTALARLPKITPILVRQFKLIPKNFRVSGLLNVTNDLVVPANRWQQLLAFYQRSSSAQRIALCRTAATIASWGDFWDLYFRCEGKFLAPFCLPDAVRLSALFAPISSPKEMMSEALRMSNCLANRISVALGGGRIFLKLRGNTPMNAELIHLREAWVPGDILGRGNAPLAPELARPIREELQRLADSITRSGDAAVTHEADVHIEKLRVWARETYPAHDIAAVAEALQSVRGKTRSWSNGAYAIFELGIGGFVQAFSSPDSLEFMVEIGSHKYDESIHARLDADTVEVIEAAGFYWPNTKDNFRRWFNVSGAEDIKAIAEVTMALLGRVLGYDSSNRLLIHTHIPD